MGADCAKANERCDVVRESRAAGTFRILHVAAPAPFGGLERVVHTLAVGQQDAGHQVHVAAVLSPEEMDHPFLPPLLERGVEVHPVRVHARDYIGEIRQISSLCKSLRPHVVHTHGYRPDVVSSAAVRWQGVPTVTTVHGFIGGSRKSRLYEWLQVRAFRSFDAIAAVSRPLADRIAGAGITSERIHLIPNAHTATTGRVDRGEGRRMLKISDDTLHIGWVGRLSMEKGLDVLIDALPLLADLPIRVTVIGDGSAREALRQQAAAAGVQHRIHWHGAVPDAGRLFSAFDVFVLSSRTEGTPMVLFEAMQAEVPIVATAVGGVPDVISSEHARLVPSENPRALASAIREVMSERHAAHRRATAAVDRLHTHFAQDSWVGRYSELYRHLHSRKQLKRVLS